ncbi:HTH-type transcriptional activator RhaR [Thauera mechernichensis]|uniref:GlxA family transcriptional regulator n=1 Tax=Thauera sp. TaxID=1905334 RepID=UPI00257BA141|nr:helix-turn-helix domain-containing protein [Thauera sp.]
MFSKRSVHGPIEADLYWLHTEHQREPLTRVRGLSGIVFFMQILEEAQTGYFIVESGQSVAMKKIAVLAYDGCWGLGVFAVTDFFRIVTLLDKHLAHEPSYHVDILGVDGGDVRLASGNLIRPDGAIGRATGYDLVVIPAVEGVRLAAGFEPDQRLVAWLIARKKQGARLLSFTTGACFIAATGVSDSLLMATHWAFIRQLKKRHPTCQFVAHPSCLQADGIWTTGSLTGYFDALLEILAQDRGDAFAQLCATHLLVSTPEKINPILPGHRNHCDEAILKVQEWIETHYAQAITIERMGREVGMAERTLKRRFQLATRLSPNVYAQKVRVDKAKKLLLATDLSIKAIAYEVGYENVSFFVRVFKTHAGQTPSKWRRAGETSVRGH